MPSITIPCSRNYFRTLLPICALAMVWAAPAAAARKAYTMEGKLQPTWFSLVFVRLSGVGTGYNARQEVYWDGKFKFKNLPAGTYSLSVVVPRMGEFRQTYSVGPSTSDHRGRVKISMVLNPAKAIRTITPRERFTVPASRLSITEKAWKEYMEAQKSLNKEDRAGAEAHLEKAIEISPQFSAAAGSWISSPPSIPKRRNLCICSGNGVTKNPPRP